MEGDDMQAVWKQYTAQLDASLRLNAIAVQQTMRMRVESALTRVGRNLAIEIVFDAILVLVIGGFGFDRAVTLRGIDVPVAAAVGMLDGYAIAILACAIIQRAGLASIAYDDTVLAIAQRFERFRLVRMRATFWTMCFAPLMWVPIVTIVLFDHMPASAFFGSAWFIANIAFGIAVLGGGMLLAKRLDRGGDPHDPVQRFAATLSGRSLREAAQRIDTLRRYEAESDALSAG